MRKYNYQIDDILLNVMACDGSSIGESHSSFLEYANFENAPNANLNGHADSAKWPTLYPKFFSKGKTPAPDLVIFGHGHNEHIDRPDEIAAYEGAGSMMFLPPERVDETVDDAPDDDVDFGRAAEED